jgi:hypothetical protein
MISRGRMPALSPNAELPVQSPDISLFIFRKIPRERALANPFRAGLKFGSFFWGHSPA